MEQHIQLSLKWHYSTTDALMHVSQKNLRISTCGYFNDLVASYVSSCMKQRLLLHPYAITLYLVDYYRNTHSWLEGIYV